MFIHLHNHTEYSLLDGAIRIRDLDGKPADVFTLAKQYKMPALAITDHGNMYGVIEFYKTCVAAGIKPIIGCEVYVAPHSRLDKTPSQGEHYYHLTLLCKNEGGYKNLMKLVSIGFTEGFYYKPRVDKEVLARYAEGLIALSGCTKGEIARLVLADKMDAARASLAQYVGIFGAENFYCELQNHHLPEQTKINAGLVQLSKEYNLKCVATNDCHYPRKADAYMHEVLLCVGTGKTIKDPTHLKFETDECYFKSPEEMQKLFPDMPEALAATVAIAQRCNVELDFSKIYLPEYKVPDGYTLDAYLAHLCEQGLPERYTTTTPEIRERLSHELAIIKDMGYSGYFLIVWDFIKFAREHDIPVGPGRGSGAGSIVSYLLHITDVDPLQYGLIFERFLNPNRKTMPDLDIDFSDDGREDVIKYVREKYGENNVAQIVTFGSMLARLALRDIGRVLDIPLKDVDRLAKLIPFGATIYTALNTSAELKKLVDEHASYKGLFELAQKIEGIKRHIGVHAAGIVISKDDMTNYVPFTKSSKDVITTQYEGESLVKLGLLKMDFLGLRNLSVIDNAVKLIKQMRDVAVDIDHLPLDDAKTFELLHNAQAMGVFQMESSGMRDLLRKIKPTVLEDIIALIALYRPGPMGSGMLDDFVARKHGKSKIVYDHPLVEPILKDTYGVILYQEQVMQMAVVLAGFSQAQADNLRQAMGKKIPEIIERERTNFIAGAKKKSISEKLATKIFDNIAKFGGYGFNKSHSTAYGIVAYRTAYLKANFPLEYMTALLNSEIGDTDRVSGYVNECREMAITILPPDVQKSFERFAIEGNCDEKKIRFGLLAVKNVGTGVRSIIEEREKNGAFKTATDFLTRIDPRTMNKKVVESLVKAGAFDSMGYSRAPLFEGLEQLSTRATHRARDAASGQGSLFGDTEIFPEKEELPKISGWSEHKKLAFEKEVLGLYISGHPLSQVGKTLKAFASTAIGSCAIMATGREITIGGIITHLKKLKTKKGDQMAALRVADMDNDIEVVVFPNTYRECRVNERAVDDIVIVRGKTDAEGEQTKIFAEAITSLADAKLKFAKKCIIEIKTAGLEKETLVALKKIFAHHPGKCHVIFNLATPHHGDVVVNSKMFVAPEHEMEEAVHKLMGENAIRYNQ